MVCRLLISEYEAINVHMIILFILKCNQIPSNLKTLITLYM